MRRQLPYLPSGAPIWFPPCEYALEGGLLLAGGDLLPERLIYAYRNGIFPWYSKGEPILWWSPDPRCVLFPKKLHIPSSLRRVLNSGHFFITSNTCFEKVMRCCANTLRPGQDGTWIQDEMICAYAKLHTMGIAHSVEAWIEGKGGMELVGGLYGLLIGKVFFGESMFHTQANASKVAFVHLVHTLAEQDVRLIDCQQTTHNLLRFGAEEISRTAFLDYLKKWCGE